MTDNMDPGLDPLTLFRRCAGPLTSVALGLPHPLPERLSGAADLGRDRADRGPLRRMIAPVLQHHPHRPLPHLRRKPVRRLLRHDPILSTVGAPTNPGRFSIDVAGTIGTKSSRAAAPARISRRHVNTCCGQTCRRRATSATTAPGSSVSATIRVVGQVP
jgi:hypothetical protein